MNETQFDAVTRTVSRLFPLLFSPPTPLGTKGGHSLQRGEGFSSSRRQVLRGLAGTGLGLAGLKLSNRAAAGKQRKGKKKAKKNQPKQRPATQSPPAVNAFGCLNVGQPCRGDNALCCSGVCQGAAPQPGAPDTSTCVAHHAGPCRAGATTCEAGTLVECVADEASMCVRTTGNAPFCGSLMIDIQKYCRVCAKDTDCQAEYGPGAACVVLDGICSGFCGVTGLTACLPPAV